RVGLRVFVDTCSVEVFADDGRAVISGLIFPQASSTGLELYAEGGEAGVRRLEVWALERAMTHP
ncbi:MAG: glycoside hydrolase, partial [Meiothermus sp.]